ncbi:hypothetical protein AB0C52_13070 [Streptomyces sp. NPDC048717]|uniref:hypothetical protein n=1 Tax=Streptomyces sp. NPDC048717 TaxID=3154928 RepID=UPI00341FD130
MIRYGLAIKALPRNGKPVGEEEDRDDISELEDGTPSEEDAAPASTPSPVQQQPSPAGGELPEESEFDETASGPDDEDSSSADEYAEAGAESDARPWSGDPYDAGDETDPDDAFAAYKGAGGEEAWLDQAPDGTLTGWVRDKSGQVWRYTDPNAWAIDVDDAPMTRTHSQAAAGPPSAGHGAQHDGQDSLFPVQK